MKFSEILKREFPDEFKNIEINGVTSDSRTVRPGYAFVCIDGTSNDGHKYALKAEENGASVIIAERDTGAKNQVIVDDTHAVYAEMCAAYFGNPAKGLKIIGVTGTNGKTSTTYILKSILESCGYKTGVIGTIQNLVGDEVLPAKNTTPDAFELHSLLSLMLKSKCEYVLMEVSSHALDQKRVWGLEFEAALITNITQDHLDYHKTMENYIAAKQKIFTMCKNAVANYDDTVCREIVKTAEKNIYTYSLVSDESTYTAKNIRYRADGSDFEFVGNDIIGRVKFNIPGEFSVYNVMGAITASLAIGLPFAEVIKAVSDVKGIKGRTEVVPTGKDFTVIIDYAHTPDGLEKILKTFKALKEHRLVI
ncbi:MAG: UDP-N-acetylmuramoyl-L-alanyl-D-glutamate--2,6-diaminopimelate ligase, partial [Acutalibacteraceae bacterium]